MKVEEWQAVRLGVQVSARSQPLSQFGLCSVDHHEAFRDSMQRSIVITLVF